MLSTFSRVFILRMIPTLALFLAFAVISASAQSTDVRFPTPVDRPEILGAIPARDIGDARLTDHFYTFNGLPGDLLITVESKNLNGDFDVFTAGELRPVLKLVVYAESSSPVTKNIYLRKPESLILRIEGRTPNDDEGTYRIRFSGSFSPVERSLISDSKPTEEVNALPGRSGDRKTTRVTSAGARIDEPVEVASLPTPQPTPASTSEETTSPLPKTPAAKAPRVRRPPARRTPSKPAGPTKTENTESTSEARVKKSSRKDDAPQPATKSEEDSAAPKKPASSERASARRAPAKSARGNGRPAKPAATVENGQLIIEVKDGSRIEYAMSTVARVTIENGEVVIVNNDGYVKRVPLTSVLRMSIGP